MGNFTIPAPPRHGSSWIVAGIIVMLNLKLPFETFLQLTVIPRRRRR